MRFLGLSVGAEMTSGCCCDGSAIWARIALANPRHRLPTQTQEPGPSVITSVMPANVATTLLPKTTQMPRIVATDASRIVAR